MHATRAAVEEGIPPGGDVALLRATEVLKRVRTHNDDQKTGVEIVRKALSWPARQIAVNSGEDGPVVLGKILEKDQYAFGFDAQNGEYVNLMSKGYHRSDQGCPRCIAGCRIRRGPTRHHGSDGCRAAEEAIGCALHARWRHGFLSAGQKPGNSC
jgi:hypothetical protein